MRPIQITIAAWGSYNEKVVVDFTRFNQGSLFLITGPTGAGKTTIFDAISFALYGDVSGKTREKGSLRSDFAAAGEDTFVELLFEHKGKQYKVYRAPKYERPKKRGEGTTTSLEVAELYVEDQQPIVIITEVNRKIEEILGLTYQQFKQVSMIAQGEFLELLVASSKDRVEILRNIFKTNQYERLQKALTEKSLRLQKNLAEQNSRLEEIVNTLDTTKEEEELQELLESPPYHYARILTLLKESIADGKKQDRIREEEIQIMEKREKKLVETIAKGEKVMEDRRRLQLLEEEHLQLEAQKQEVVLKQEKAKCALKAMQVESFDRMYASSVTRYTNAKGKWEKIKAELEEVKPEHTKRQEQFQQIEGMEKVLLQLQMKQQQVEGYVPLMEEITTLEKKREQNLVEYKKNKENQQASLEEQKQLQETYEKEKEEYASYENLEVAIEQNKAKQEKQNTQLNRIRVLQQKKQELEDQIRNWQALVPAYKAIEEEQMQAKRIYDEKEMEYRRAIVGIVARELEEGKPCPVCGSTSHPKKAVVAHDVPNEKEVEEYKKTAEKKNAAYQQYFIKMTGMKEKQKALQEELEHSCLEQDLAINQIEGRENELLLALQELQQEEQLLGKKKTKKEAVKNCIVEREKAIKDVENILSQLGNKAQLLQQEQRQWEEQLQQKKEALPVEYKTVEAITETLTTLKNQIAASKKEISAIRENYEKINSRFDQLQALRCEREEEMRSIHGQSKEEKKNLEEALIKYGFSSREAYQQAFLPEEERTRLEQEIKQYMDTYSQNEAQQKTLKETIGKEQVLPLEDLRKEQESCRNKKAELLEKQQISHTKRMVNQKASQALEEKIKKRAVLEEEYGVLKQLDNVTKGNNSERLVFEQYVLASYFEDILHAANLRLLVMTNSRYELMRSMGVNDARKKDSLDLEVLDHYTGKKRSVKSLSGGESFKAALSLALGMSDIIQSYAGGIQIDTLFIDEGFGSLDTESLEQALETLSGLTEKNRLIGIISHVNELKERINDQIVVERGKHGSTLYMKTI
ncbi:AAA family ATPase [Anaerosporobacter faecicola]|uniref:AAA family ATPase n=1 Tax=Anaerosporobacter faecicola TaxID=2718714 RepID=UPI00143B6452|nr:AAA family ATPase [Anaerosporobacter faecicola]